MKILVANHRLHQLVVFVSGRIGVGKNVLGVKQVEALVLHGPRIEVGHRNNHEPLKVKLKAEASLVPGHRVLQALKCKLRAAQVLRAGVYLQLLARARQAGHKGF